MTPAGHKPHQLPSFVKGANGEPIRVGDRVKTSLGHFAIIKSFRCDGYVDGEYEGRHPVLAAVILQPHLLVRA